MSEDQPRPKTVFSIEEPPIELMIQRIDERLKVLGLTDRQASIRATGLPDAIREIRRFKRPGSKRMIQLAKALETTPDWLGGYVDHQRGKVWLESTESALPIYGVADLPRDIPVFAASVDETAPAFFKDIVEKEHSIEVKKRLYVMCFGYNFNDPIDFARRPPRLAKRDDCYGIIIHDDALYPRFEISDVLYVDPRRHAAPGEYALVRIKKEAIPDFKTQGEWAFIAQIDPDKSERLDQPWALRVFNPDLRFTLDRRTVAEAHRIIPWSELLSL